MQITLDTQAKSSLSVYCVLGSGWKGRGAQWTQTKLMERLATSGELFTSWRNSFQKYQMHKRLHQGLASWNNNYNN